MMSTIEKLSVAVTGEQATSIRAVIASGEYATTSEVIREALRDWQTKRNLRQEDIDRIRALWDAGIASGSAGVVDFEQLRRDAEFRLAEAKKRG
jgi:antitoxin ParD1/3/4